MDRSVRKNFIIDTFYTLIVAFLVVLVSFVLFKYLFPFVIAALIAILVQKPANLLSRKINLKQGIAAAVLSVGVFLIFGAVLCFCVYKLAGFLIGLGEFLPSLFKKVSLYFGEIEVKYDKIFTYFSQNFNISLDALIQNSLQKIIDSIGSGISNFAKNIVTNAPSFFISSIVTLVASCYISKDFLMLKRFVINLIGKEKSEKIAKIKNIFNFSILRLLRGYFILLLITFSLLFLGFIILRVENAFTIALLIAIADLLPVIGTGTVLVPWAVISALLGNYFLSISLAVLFVVIVITRNFLEPKIIGNQIGVNSLFTLAVMFLGLRLLGVLGLVLFPIIFIVVIRYYKSEMSEEIAN